MTSTTYTIREEAGYRLVGRYEDDRRTVVRVGKGQVCDAMPGDAPRGGGSWSARDTHAGIDYVAHWYSRSYAGRVYRALVREAEDAR